MGDTPPPRRGLVWFVPLFLCISLLVTGFAPSPQGLPTAVTLTVEAGFDGYFRENTWLPVWVRVRNDGGDVEGRLLIRPETSGDGLYNAYSTPIDLTTNARQTARVDVSARAFAQQVRVEFVNADGLVIAAQRAPLRSLQMGDHLAVVISESVSGTVDVTSIRFGAYEGFQSEMSIAEVPDRAPALDAVNLMVIHDADTGALSLSQRTALADWVAAGGHLIVTGGAGWQATAAGISDLLPINPNEAVVAADLSPLKTWARVTDNADLSAQTVLAAGDLHSSAEALVSVTADDGTVRPLIARRFIGSGVVDYLAVDPIAQPLRGWAGMNDVWFALATSTGGQPGWAHGIVDWGQAGRAVEVMPGVDPLPDIVPLLAFLLGYIALIGPLNYLLLSRLNRREWAWVTIPVVILVFTGAAYLLGFNLRGNDATINHLTLVQSWANAERARVDGLVGLLSPRRAEYSLTAVSGSLRPIPRTLQGRSLLNRDTTASVEIEQGERYAAQSFTVDASFIAGFQVSGMIDRPAISGRATVLFDETAGQQTVRGSVRNDSGLILTEPVILARGVALRLNEPLVPGAVATFELTLPGQLLPAPAVYLPFTGTTARLVGGRSNAASLLSKQSVFDIVGTRGYNTNTLMWTFGDAPEQQALLRRLLFTAAVVDDGVTTAGRGSGVYLAGWSDDAPLKVDLTGANWNEQRTALYVVELQTEWTPPTNEITVPVEQFTWLVRGQNGIGEWSPSDITLQPGDTITFQYTPFPEARLTNVNGLTIRFRDSSTGSRTIPVQLYDWDAGAWERVEVTGGERKLDRPSRFLGANNAVQVRLTADEIGGFLRIGRLDVEQSGFY